MDYLQKVPGRNMCSRTLKCNGLADRLPEVDLDEVIFQEQLADNSKGLIRFE